MTIKAIWNVLIVWTRNRALPRKQTCSLRESSTVVCEPRLILKVYRLSAGKEQTLRISFQKLVPQFGSNFMSVLFHYKNMAIMYACGFFLILLLLFCFVLCITLFFILFLVIHSLFYFRKISVKDGLRKEKRLLFSIESLRSTVLEWTPHPPCKV